MIGVSGLHHCIAGFVEIFTAMFTGNNITIYHYIHFISLTVPGNIIGRTIFVADLKVSCNKKEDMKRKISKLFSSTFFDHMVIPVCSGTAHFPTFLKNGAINSYERIFEALS